MLRIQIWYMEMEQTASMTGPSTFCHMMTQNFAQDAFINKHHMRKMCLARRLLHWKEHRQNMQRDHMSFPELVGLVRMNIQTRIGWYDVRRLK